jgi:hypothetical protein
VEAGALNELTDLTLNIRYDDGFVAYLNGIEVARRNFDGTPEWDSRASASHRDSDAREFEPIDISDFMGELRRGENILAIQGMNRSITSSDLLISAELEAEITISDDPGAIEFTKAMDLLAGLRVTELMYHAIEGSESDYIELQNISQTALDLTGVRLDRGITYTFPAMTLEAGRHVVVVKDLAAFKSNYGENIFVAGEYSGNLSNGGEKIVLQLPWPLEAAILRFEYNDAWYPDTDGAGQSLAVIDASAHTAAWNWSGNWYSAAPSPGR